MKLHAVWKDNGSSRGWSWVSLDWFFLLFGLVALDTYIWINVSTTLYQAYIDWSFDQRLRGLTPSPQGFAKDEIRTLLGRDRASPESAEHPAPPDKRESSPTTKPLETKPAMPSDIIGRLEIPNLHLSAMVREGADAGTLRRAVGHIPGTALPGRAGNVGLAGHRDTFFRPLRNIRTKDVIELRTEKGMYRYLVESTSVVRPRDVGVLASSNEEILTLVTCYPFYYVGSAPQRFIVRAALASVDPQHEMAPGH